jgi:hypothetical protein|tara:strand:- start:265 stop:549 length:285 start_codon:yes stop_codon:yes gene_type:complete
MIDIEYVVPGETYACKFKVETMLDVAGHPVQLNVGEQAYGPGMYEGFGILVKRDMGNEMVELTDQKSGKNFFVPFAQIWDIDTVVWQETEDDGR